MTGRLIRPPALHAGSRVALVAPASAFPREAFEAGCTEIRALGYEPVFDERIFERSCFTAGGPDARAASFMRAWEDPEVAALVAIRGGYGSVQLLPEFDGWDPRPTPKVFVGYSDTTSLLTWLTCQCGIATLHGPMVDGRLAQGAAGYDRASFSALLEGRGAGLTLAPDGLESLRPGVATGTLVGGTLTQLCASFGTPYAFEPPDRCVLFIEDVNERPYRLDRMLTQLRLSGLLWRASALVFGEMRGCDEPDGGVTARAVAGSFAEEFDGPVLFGFPSGHTSGPCWTLPFGVAVTVGASERPFVRVEESPVV